jgi:predicted phage tail component-like protein
MMQGMTGLRGFTFNGKHNNDFKVVMQSKLIQSPPKKKIKDSVPFANGSYDFSTVGSNGEIVYGERSITISIGIPAETKEELQVVYSKVHEWLVDTGKQKLVFDDMKDYYFMAEVEEATTFEQTMAFGKLDIKFTADPFKSSVDVIGANVWDIFNFEEDYLQDSSYDVNGSIDIIMYNSGRTVRPVINCSLPMTMISQNGKSYNLTVGDNKPYGFYLNNGANDLRVNGTGKINFIFRKESI